MALEIERKFLIFDQSWRDAVRSSMRMRQGYLNQCASSSVRVRTSSKQAWINIKSATLGAQRHEFEYEIPIEDGDFLLMNLCHRPLIEKIRHLVDVGSHTWEIDEFYGDNAGLIVAEIELSDRDEVFDRPRWLGSEVTDDPRYYNTQLCLNPYTRW